MVLCQEGHAKLIFYSKWLIHLSQTVSASFCLQRRLQKARRLDVHLVHAPSPSFSICFCCFVWIELFRLFYLVSEFGILIFRDNSVSLIAPQATDFGQLLKWPRFLFLMFDILFWTDWSDTNNCVLLTRELNWKTQHIRNELTGVICNYKA